MIAAQPLGVKIENIRFYIRIKWLILALLFLTNLFENLSGLTSVFQGSVVYLGIFIVALPIFLIEWSIRKNKMVNLVTSISLCLDILIIVLVLYFHGGIENSWLFLPIFAIFLSSYIFGLFAGIAYAVFAYIVVIVMAIAQFTGFIPHFPLFDLPEAHWRNIQYIFDYMTGMFVLYMASAFSIGFLTRLAQQRAERLNEYKEKLGKFSKGEEEQKRRIHEIQGEIAIKGAELEHLEVITADQQIRIIELKGELEKLRGQ